VQARRLTMPLARPPTGLGRTTHARVPAVAAVPPATECIGQGSKELKLLSCPKRELVAPKEKRINRAGRGMCLAISARATASTGMQE
jgi:hypothetical protein